MSKHNHLLLMKLRTIIPLLFLFYTCVSSQPINRDEASILLSIKASFIDPLNHLNTWESSTNASLHCSWSGVQCSLNGAVVELNLSHMNLSGRVPDEIQLLQSLTSLNLSSNAFACPLPLSLANLTALEAIDLSQNYFTDQFPSGLGSAPGLVSVNASGNNFSGYLPRDLANATLLESLDVRGNFFQGSIPTAYMSLNRLKFLGLSGNNLTGKIPLEIGEMTSLETAVLGYNEFEGGIPSQFGNLSSLKYLDLAVANLRGRIPAELGELKELTTLFLYKNNLEGRIPPEISGMASLQLLDLSDNALSGEIPARIGDLKNLQLLNLMCNELSGAVPASITTLTQLTVLELWNNTFSGPLPRDLGRDMPLQWLDISSNSITGLIPTTLCSRGNLTKLILFNNAFSGPIPASLSTCTSLVRVRMQNNLLSGTIPVGFGKLGKLQRLELANNSLTGQIPTDLSTSTSLSSIDISRNHLQSSLPPSILTIPSLQSFIASGNSLTGEIPDQFQDCPSLSVMDLSSNHFVGSIPTSIASCDKLVNLNLRDNELSGEIPKSIAKMPTLAVLDLSNNSLTGEIPQDFGNSPALEMLNVSYNKLVGAVPSNGMLHTINPDDLAGNVALCGGVLPPCSKNAAAFASNLEKKKHIVRGWIIGLSTLVALFVAGVGVRFLYPIWQDESSSFCFKERLERANGAWPWRLMAFQRLGFNSSEILASVKESNVIGMGATGTVYKAEIQRLNTTVAVKKLWRWRKSDGDDDVEVGGSDDLVGEVNLLGRLRHRNIVRLLGFLHNDSDAMIIYEFMVNGSLGEALHRKKAGVLMVDWVTRYNIAIGVAQGLAYLHHDCHPPVIHRDVKSNNILLNANLEARLADFGLAKMMMKKNETVSVVAGSYGYIAPEYGYTLKVDEKSDIYSYGVVLMELVTGKRPLEEAEFGGCVDIVEWIRGKTRKEGGLEETLDPSICNAKHVAEEMLLVLRLAILCTAKQPRDRPSMRDVVSMLAEAKPRRKTAASDENRAVFTAASSSVNHV
ncbi:hypothetical protein SASPL_106202 [Salvia splendens]|uniref:non-specific serine/threonine protein kinase n=2 Tax=Salvia splendens TaxID=180675 RepID=A0A8X9ACA7_SALSN|nr:hypothetical protein SASPL_106202 [Salvia splendens]